MSTRISDSLGATRPALTPFVPSVSKHVGATPFDRDQVKRPPDVSGKAGGLDGLIARMNGKRAVGVAGLLLTACGNPASQPANTQIRAAAAGRQRAATADPRIFCAHRDAPLARTCTVDRTTDDRGLILTLRHPDGGFHRVLVTHDGRGVVAADGAGYALVSIVDRNGIEVRIDRDHYRLPATIADRAS